MRTLMLLAVLCADPDPDREPAPAAPAPKPGTCTVAGKVVLTRKGTPVDRRKDRRGVVAYVEGPGSCGKRATRQMAQKDKQFDPPVLAVCAGDLVEFPNNDPFSHEVNAQGAANHFSSQRNAAEKTATREFKYTELTPIACDIHMGMHAWVVVLKNRLFDDQLDAEDRFVIEGVPAKGDRKLVIWESTDVKTELKLPDCTSPTLDAGTITFEVRPIPKPIY